MNEMILQRNVDKKQSFLLAIRDIRKAIAFLERKYGGTTVAERLEYAADVTHANLRLDLLSLERPDRVCVLILGEFKAGKSTLINALVGQTVAATDTFEMTTAVARIIPTNEKEAKVVLANKRTERETKILSLDEFLQFSFAQAEKLKTNSSAVIDGYTQARIFVNSDLDCELVDTPGLGATLDNELNAVDAVSTCDIVLWTVDAQNIGGTREAAMLENIRQRGQPLICALTKSDVLEPEDILPTIEYLSNSYSLAPAFIFAVAAEKYLIDKSDLGTTRLKNYIQTEVVAKGKMLRETALFAQAADIASEIDHSLTEVEKSIGAALSDAKENQSAFLAMAHNVTDQLCIEIASAIELQLQADINQHITGKDDNLTEEKIRQSLQYTMDGLNAASLFNQLGLHENYKNLWLDGIKSELQTLRTSLSQVRQEAVHQATDLVAPVIEKQIRATENKEKAVQHGMAAVGIVTGVTITFGVNVGIGLLAAVPEIYSAYKAYNMSSESKHESDILQAAKKTSNVFARLASNLVDQELKPSLKSRNEQVAKVATNDFVEKNGLWPLSFDELAEVYQECLIAKDTLKQI